MQNIFIFYECLNCGHMYQDDPVSECDCGHNSNQFEKRKLVDINSISIKVNCSHCNGKGKCNDADLGDMFYNEYPCNKCNGTGEETYG